MAVGLITAANWRLTTASGLTRLALLQRFTHADDGRDARGQRTLSLGGHHGIGFAMVLAALGMAHST